jgi:hypothetical protein
MAVKIGCRLVSLLFGNHLPAVVATPYGDAPQWFEESVPVIAQSEVAARIKTGDCLVVGSDGKSSALDISSNVRRIIHCEPDQAFSIETKASSYDEVWTSSPWMRSGHYICSGQSIRNMGLHVHRNFFYDGREKDPGRVCCSIRGAEEISEVGGYQTNHDGIEILSDLVEFESADHLKSASFYISFSTGAGAAQAELEAMAAGCIVVRHANSRRDCHVLDGHNCVHSTREQLRCTIESLAGSARRSRREALRHAAIATAADYTRQSHSRWLRAQIAESQVSRTA